MKKKKIELGRKLFLKKDTIAGLNAAESGNIVGGAWVTHVRETEIDPSPIPQCMSCAPTVQNGCPTHIYSQCQTYFVNGQCCAIISDHPPC